MEQEAPRQPSLSWHDIRSRIREVVLFLPTFFKNPVEGMKRVPSWDWPTAIITEILLAGATGMLAGIVARHWLSILGGLILGPIMGMIISLMISAFMYYSCLILLKTELEFRKIFVVVVLAKVPSQLLGILTPIAHPVVPFGIILTALLLIVGMVENFMLEKKKMVQIIGTIAGVIILSWLYASIMEATSNRIKVQDYTPETLDQLQKETNQLNK